MLNASVTYFAEATRDRIHKLSAWFTIHGMTDHAAAAHKAIVAIAAAIGRQADIMAFSDTFYLLGVALLLSKPDHLDAAASH